MAPKPPGRLGTPRRSRGAPRWRRQAPPTSRGLGPATGKDRHGHDHGIGSPGAGAQVAGRGHDVLPDGRPDAGDGGRLHQARHPRHRHAPRAGRGVGGARLDARDAAPRRLHGRSGPGATICSPAWPTPSPTARRWSPSAAPARACSSAWRPSRRSTRSRCSSPSPSGPSASTTPSASPTSSPPRSARRPAAGPGPVYLDMPGDVLGEKIEEEQRHVPRPPGSRRRARSATPARSRRPSRCSRKAERPLIIARQRRVVVGRRRRAAGLRRGHRHPVLHDADLARPHPRGPRAVVPERAQQGVHRGRRRAGGRHALQLDDPVRAAAALRAPTSR